MRSTTSLSFGIETILSDTPVFICGDIKTSESQAVLERAESQEHVSPLQLSPSRDSPLVSPSQDSQHSPANSSSAPSADESMDENAEPKRKKMRTTFEPEQVRFLEDFYSKQHYLPASQRKKMAVKLGLTDQQVKTWFQNRRMKAKRLQRESIHAANCLDPAVAFLPTAPQIHPSPLALHNLISTKQALVKSDVINRSPSLHRFQPMSFPASSSTSPTGLMRSAPTSTLRIQVPSFNDQVAAPRNHIGLLACKTSIPSTSFVSRHPIPTTSATQICGIPTSGSFGFRSELSLSPEGTKDFKFFPRNVTVCDNRLSL